MFLDHYSSNDTNIYINDCIQIYTCIIICVKKNIKIISEEDVSSQAADVCIGYIYAIMMNGFYAMTKGFLNG